MGDMLDNRPSAESKFDSAAEATAPANDPFMGLKQGGVELYIVRHADALPDPTEVVQGGYDDQALSALGKQQADALANRLRDVEFAAIYSSPLGRAIQTVQPTATLHGLEIHPLEGLREVALGSLSSDAMPKGSGEEIATQLRTRLREIVYIAVTTGRWDSIAGSEPSAQLRARLTATIDRIIAAHTGERVLIVSHAGAINAYLAAVLGLAHDYFFPTANTSISVMRAQGERRMVFSLNDIGHLLAAGLFPPRD